MAHDEGEGGRHELSRREWLALAGLGGSSAVATLMGATFLRSLHLDLLYEPSKRFRVGTPEQFPLGRVVRLAHRPLFIGRDREGLYAISAVCTHLGCIVATSREGFACPCHGSRYDPTGRVIGGPAPRSLPWWRMQYAPDGQVVVDATRTVKRGEKLKVLT